jgi:hypothetical protein
VRGGSVSTDSVFSVVIQLPNTMAPGTYQLAVTIAETGSGRFTSVKRTVVCDDLDRSPAMSSVCFSSRIEPVTRDSAFNRGALEVVPKPSATYPLATPVPIYFEVYNLTADAAGAYRYRVSYRVAPLTPAPRGLLKKVLGKQDEAAALASSFSSAAAAPQDVVYVFLKTDQLWPGEYDFHVSIVDEVSQSETSRQGRFRLIE